MGFPPGSDSTTRRDALRRTLAVGTVCLGTPFVTGATSARQGGVGYLKERHLRGRNNPDEPRFRLVERCRNVTVELPCDGAGGRRYTAYKIRCPDFRGGGGNDHESDGHDGGCQGGDGCGRRILVNSFRTLGTGDLYEFVSIRDCGDGYVKATFRPA